MQEDIQNTFDNLMSNIAIPEPNGPTTRRHEHPNPQKAEENDFKYNFMKMIQALREEKKNSLKEMEENTNIKLE